MNDPENQKLLRACYTGMFVQAMVINLTPLLFIPLRELLGLSFEQVGRLVLINFLVQMAVDLVCCGLADRTSVKLLTVLANLLAGFGLCLFALAPGWMPDPYAGLVLGTVVFSAGCGLLEVLLSPIVNAVPSERKAGSMAILHAFYPIGKVVVILFTGYALYRFGARHWHWIALAWAVVPLANAANFLRVRIPRLSEAGRRQTLRSLVRLPSFWLAVLALGFAGATELTLAQWTSAFLQAGLGLSKAAADLAGFVLFAAGMIAGRIWFGFRGESEHLRGALLGGGLGAAGACLLLAFSPWPALSLAACALGGFSVSLLWPGIVSLAAARFPLAGASMFALLVAAGDAGAGLMPWAFGAIADRAAAFPEWVRLAGAVPGSESLGLRAGLLAAALCPLAMAFLLAPLFHRCHREPGRAMTGAHE